MRLLMVDESGASGEAPAQGTPGQGGQDDHRREVGRVMYAYCAGVGREVRRGPDSPVSRVAACPVCGKTVVLTMWGFIRAHKDDRKQGP